MLLFTDWLKEFAYVGKGIAEGTIENSLLHFFYEGLTPFIHSSGYKWLETENAIATKFLRFCYILYETSHMDSKYTLEVPAPRHRGLQEDRDTFDLILDTRCFIDLMDEWSHCDIIIGTRLDYLLREFCYVWLDVESGKPGTKTQIALDASSENDSDDENKNTMIPDGNWSRRKYDLY